MVSPPVSSVDVIGDQLIWILELDVLSSSTGVFILVGAVLIVAPTKLALEYEPQPFTLKALTIALTSVPLVY